MQLSVADRRITVNLVLSLMLLYFLALWAGSIIVIRQIWANLQNILCLESVIRVRSRACWTNVCAPKAMGGLNMIDLEKALHALLTKWILKALCIADANLKILLRFGLSKLKPNSREKWVSLLNWALTHKFSASSEYKVWNMLNKTWKLHASKINFLPSKTGPKTMLL